jgi:hypothetical protein
VAEMEEDPAARRALLLEPYRDTAGSVGWAVAVRRMRKRVRGRVRARVRCSEKWQWC